MSVAVETSVSRMSLPVPTHFSHAEQTFSLKKRHFPFSSSSNSNSSYCSPSHLSHSLPPLPPSKGCPPLSRMFPQQPTPWTPLSGSLSKTPPPNAVYDPSKQQSYFNQCYTNLGLLGRGSFGEVYKVKSNLDGRQYAVKRSAHRFRGNSERSRSTREAKNHERLCPHPHILDFVAAWEESGRLYIQTELCSTSLLLHAENQPPGPDEPAAWAYLCDLLSALQHLHSLGFVHLDLKPANVLITDSGRLKLADFGLLFELKKKSTGSLEGKGKDDIQEGDPRYMAPELLRGEYGPAADVFSLGVSILELACNMEVPNGGEGWQQLRQGCLPSEFTSGLSAELQAVLRMMLAPEPSERPTVSELQSLPSVRKHRWRRRIYLMVAETTLTLLSFGQLVVCRLLSSLHLSFLPHWSKPVPSTPPKGSWDKDLTLPLSAMHADSGSPEDDAVFLLDQTDVELSPTFSHRIIWTVRGQHIHSSAKIPETHIHSNGSCHTLTPSISPLHIELFADSINEKSTQSPHSVANKSSQRRSWIRTEEALPRPNFEPKNLLSLFEDTTDQPIKMSDIDCLNARVEKLLCEAVQEVLEVVKETVSEYQEKTARTQRENQSLKRKLQELQEKLHLESNGTVAQLSHRPLIEQRQKEKLGEDFELITSDKDIVVISPSYSFEDIDSEASITSFAAPCLSPGAKTHTHLGGDDLNNLRALLTETNNKLAISNHVYLSENQHKMKREPTSDEDSIHTTNCFYDDAGTSTASSHRLNSEHPQGHSVSSLEQNGTSEPPSQRDDNTNSVSAKKQHTNHTIAVASGSRVFQRNDRKHYSCLLCGRTFRHAGDYKKHNRVHTGEKPYCCSVCGKRFSQSGYLTVHQRFHTGEKPFTCTHCDKSFSHSSNLKKHQQTHL
ncbi:Membrane-associated tyrosine- and threonine-specific cdc2-inhibitory kinase [Dissostichus eleginoides]|uniref:non-specific serine/threonine protein kinase n=1 Tax=Dissostichus eleginoides TaxID=100907 RepID=A0AAD9BDH4_DISEL|nr:Membrane-associated tyrosine- and threonine-specific cdc2-inhibitory kinase [Dissostichus eleginoides]